MKIGGKTLLDSARNENATHAAPIESGEGPRKSFLRRLFSHGKIAIRGDRYGTANNSTILAPADAAIQVGVEPTLEASKETWQRAWKLHRFMMRAVLHRCDRCRPTDSKLAL